MSNNFIEMKESDIKILKEKLWIANGKKCPVLNKEIPLDKMVLDHIHKRNDDEYAPDKGVIREALDFRVNAILGKVENAVKRTGLDKDPDFSMGDFLRYAADYFERGAYQDDNGNYYVHPKEVKKEPKLMKSSYNELKKEYKKSGLKARFPEYPKSKKMTKSLEKFYKQLNIIPKFYS